MIPLLESIEEKTCAVEDKYAQLWAYAAGAPIKDCTGWYKTIYGTDEAAYERWM